MVSGFDRYYQIARCFRDEDLRADRQPEFTQIDIELSFTDEAEVMKLTEGMVQTLFKQHLDVELGDFPQMTWHEAMERFGSDKPDLRIDLELVSIDDLMKDVEFKVFSGPANDEKGRVAALRVPGGAKISRKEIDDFTKYVGNYGARGLAWIKVNDKAAGVEGLQSPILKFMPEATGSQLCERLALEDGDSVFCGADKRQVVNDALGALRLKVAEMMGLVGDGWAPSGLLISPCSKRRVMVV